MRGRKPENANLALVRASRARSRLASTKHKESQHAPKAARERRPAEEIGPWLNDRGRHWFGELVDQASALGTYSPVFDPLLALAADRFAEIETLTDLIDGQPVYKFVTKDGGTLFRTHPAVSQINEAKRHLAALLAELGLTPSTLARVGKPPAAS